MLENHDDNDKTIFVGNLHSSVTDEILYELFLQAGPVLKVTIPTDREGNRRSYGFVRYKHAETVPYAAELLNGIRLYGRPLTLKCSFAHTLQTDAARADLWSRLAGHRFQQHHGGSDLMPGLSLPHSFMTPVLEPPWPLVATTSSTAPFWSNSWIPCSNGQSQDLDCTNSSKGDEGHNSQSGKGHKHRRKDKRHKYKRKR